MSDPLVSCIVPVYNGERYLAEALESILGQSYRTLEIIVVDDGSTDGSAEVARATQDSIRLLVQANAGQAAAVNAGVRASQGSFLAFLDADDRWHPEKLMLQMARFREDAELGYCVGGMRNFLSPDLELQQGATVDPELLKAHPAHVLNTLCLRRSLFDRVGPLEEQRGHTHDTEWFMRMRKLGAKGAVLPQVIVERRLHKSNRSIERAAASRAEYLELVHAELARKRREAGD